MTICLVTKNPGKLRAAQVVFDKFKIELKQLTTEFPEIQASSSLEIARYTATIAAKTVHQPVIREDHSLFVNFLGFPGPYTSYVEKQISPKKLLQLLSLAKDRTGYFEIATVYVHPDGDKQEFVYQVPIYIKEREAVKDPRGGWNGLICLKGETRAFSEYPEEDRLQVWSKNYYRIAKHLTSKA
jgi:XTP/dITP diphosphohydrolase